MMRPVGELVEALAAELTPRLESGAAGLALEVTRLEVDAPIEARIGAEMGLAASLPRGRLATGFDPPLGHLRARFERGPA